MSPGRVIFLMKKSTPIVCLYEGAKVSLAKRVAIDVFPTVPLPIRMTLRGEEEEAERTRARRTGRGGRGVRGGEVWGLRLRTKTRCGCRESSSYFVLAEILLAIRVAVVAALLHGLKVVA